MPPNSPPRSPDRCRYERRPRPPSKNSRRKRLRRVRARADFNRFAYHARGPIALARDAVLALRSPASLAADFDWLYGYRPVDLKARGRRRGSDRVINSYRRVA